MPSTSEKGHAKNVANLSKLIEVCKGFGTKYNPSKTSIKVANLTIKLNTSKQQLQDIKDTAQAETTARNNRAIGYKGSNKFSTRVLAAIKASDASAESIADAISINKKIQGERITEAKKLKKQQMEQKQTILFLHLKCHTQTSLTTTESIKLCLLH